VLPIPKKTAFRYRHERLAYLEACEDGRRILANPSLRDVPRRFVQEAMAPHPNQRTQAARWRKVLALPPEQVAALLVEDVRRARIGATIGRISDEEAVALNRSLLVFLGFA
jgi:hypothetical protein